MITTKRIYKCDFCDNTIETIETEGYIESLKCVFHSYESKPLPLKKWFHISSKLVCDKHIVKVDDKVVKVMIDN